MWNSYTIGWESAMHWDLLYETPAYAWEEERRGALCTSLFFFGGGSNACHVTAPLAEDFYLVLFLN